MSAIINETSKGDEGSSKDFQGTHLREINSETSQANTQHDSTQNKSGADEISVGKAAEVKLTARQKQRRLKKLRETEKQLKREVNKHTLDQKLQAKERSVKELKEVLREKEKENETPKLSEESDASLNDKSEVREEERVEKPTDNAKKSSMSKSAEYQRKWFQSAWNVAQFDTELPYNKQKLKWKEFQNDLENEFQSRGEATDEMKILAVKKNAKGTLKNAIARISKDTGSMDYKEFMGKLSKHFDTTTSIDLENSCLRQMKQKSDESFATWVNRVYEQVELCGYDTEEKKDEEVRRAITASSCKYIADELFKRTSDYGKDLDKYVTLGNIIETQTQVKKGEETASEQSVMYQDQGKRGNGSRSEFSNRNRERSKPYDRRPKNYNSRRPPRKEFSNEYCPRCGYEKHRQGSQCPAMGQTCNKCQKPNHFARVCRAFEGKDERYKKTANLLEDDGITETKVEQDYE